jgi:hypothetical protein
MNIHTILVNSKNRNGGSSSRFDMALKNGITNINGFAIGNIKIPKTYYNITSLNNNFRFFDSLTTQYDLVIPEGNYDLAQLMTWLDVNMNLVSPDTYHFNLNQITNKIDICTAAGTWQLDFTIDNNLATKLGYEEELYDSSLNDIGNQGIQAPNSPNMQRTCRVHIVCNEIHRNNFHFNNSVGFGNILDTVIDDVEFGGQIIKRQDFNAFYSLTRANFVSTMSFYLLDDNGKQLDLNGEDWTMEIHIKVSC